MREVPVSTMPVQELGVVQKTSCPNDIALIPIAQ
jgi:hypothetical protein